MTDDGNRKKFGCSFYYEYFFGNIRIFFVIFTLNICNKFFCCIKSAGIKKVIKKINNA